MSNASELFQPLNAGGLALANRIVMAPMTRSRATPDGVPSPLAAEYYSSRASAGLLITEGTQPSYGGQGYARTPSIHTPEQAAAWKLVADAVHARGGRIFLQLMHVGRIAQANNRQVADQPVAPSAVRAPGQVWTDQGGLQNYDQPRALALSEIPAVIAEFAAATRLAIEAGLDGVELHAASGYLPHQFLSTNVNQRTDAYGGDAAGRIRFVVETLQAMVAAAGSPARVGIKISPEMPFNGIEDKDPATYPALVEALNPLGLAYLHVMRASPTTDYLALLRPLWKGVLVAGAGFTAESGAAAIASGVADAIAYGKFYIANPDLKERFEQGLPLSEADGSTFYTPGAKGYTDYARASV
ncbi:MAG: alkene reductase [Acidobacteria bacterium]|nr:alkene reductase [Acidobacteriota bacterium]